MKYGRTDGKKIILHADIAGNVNQDQLWAILDTVDSDFEENIDDLMVDSNTEFRTITYDATALINNVEEAKSSKMPLLTENTLEAVVHTDPPTSSVHHQTASNNQPGASKSIATEGRDGEESIDFSLAPMRSVRSGTKSRRVKCEPSGMLYTFCQFRQKCKLRNLLSSRSKSRDNSKIKKKTGCTMKCCQC